MSKEINLKIDENLITPEVKEFAKIAQECIEEFPKIAQECVELYAKKNADYGNAFDANIDKFGEVVATIRIGDKYSRLEQLTKPNSKANVEDESIDDTLIDLACYAIMALSYRRRRQLDV
jgi:hypothetical protein